MLAWEKIIVWILAIVVCMVILFFLVKNLQPGGTGVAGSFFTGIKNMPTG